MDQHQPQLQKARTGVPGLDDILAGGFTRGRVFLLEGSPGTGKTTIALRFLMEGATEGERGLYITLSETANELRSAAASHGWQLGDLIEIFEVAPPEKHRKLSGMADTNVFAHDRLCLDGGSARTGVVVGAEIRDGRYRIIKATAVAPIDAATR